MIPIRPFGSIFRDQVIDPFAFFQLFSVFLWMMDDNRVFSLIILVMLVGSAYAISVQRIKTLVGYRSMTLAPHQTYVFKEGQWTLKSSYELLPGDIVAIQPGYQHKKSEFDMMSDA
jgi:cation-transporting ATPase 13A1